MGVDTSYFDNIQVVPVSMLRELIIQLYDGTDGETLFYVMRRPQEDRAPLPLRHLMTALNFLFNYTVGGNWHFQGSYSGMDGLDKAEAYVAEMKAKFPETQDDLWEIWLGKLNEGLPIERLRPRWRARVNGTASTNYVAIEKSRLETLMRTFDEVFKRA